MLRFTLISFVFINILMKIIRHDLIQSYFTLFCILYHVNTTSREDNFYNFGRFFITKNNDE